MQKIPDLLRLRESIDYDRETGIFRRKSPTKGHAAGQVIGGKRRNANYVVFEGVQYRAHRLAWFYVTGNWPTELIDHIDGDFYNDAFANLREATVEENGRNCKKPISNTSGFKGVQFVKRRKKYRALIKVRNRQIFLGYFDDPQLAHAAYVKAAKEHFGEFARAA